jgi:hypothetical protein
MTKKLLILICLCFGISLWSNAQSFYNFGQNRTLAVSAGFGNASYYGDLKDPRDYFDPQFNFTAGLQYYWHPKFSVRADLTWFKLEGSDEDTDYAPRNIRNLSFKSSNFELDFTAAYSFLETPVRFYQRPVINGYVFAGLGVLRTNPTAEYNGVRYALQPLRTENIDYSRFQFVLPFGIGARFRASDYFNVILEAGYRKTFTDYLDDVSTRHPDKSTWTDPVRIALSDRRPELGLSPNEPGSIRGDPSDKDGYLLINIKVEYYLKNNFLQPNNQRKLYNKKRKSYYKKTGIKRNTRRR